ncbi:DNA-binding domain-containing protein [Cupriavidus basilensis]|uniref:DNA-binding domain-containing protein n=1 Tax=Cupriavidus basilensis TaxID=68895 RepID=A0ABT6AGS3_9BURK|nr:DNA-binding domain-containing protein [Cupriavidus basilensis]MDF3831794.1 DNA-binding domain-containing protein [Cupriavidus basilensis]
MTQTAPTLLELQRAFGQSLLRGADNGVTAYVVAGGLAPQARLNIYRNTAISVLSTALRLSYPAVQALVGEEFFEGAARLFLEASPPQSAWLDEYGSTFPDFLEQLPRAATLSYLPDTARLEWTINTVQHAPEATPLALAQLTCLTDAEMGRTCFERHPAAQLMRSEYPVDAIWCAVLAHDDDALEAIDIAGDPVCLLIRHTESGIAIDRLHGCQWRIAASLFAGRPLHACLDETTPAEIHSLLATLLAGGCFTRFSIAAQTFDQCTRDVSS